MNKFSGFYEQLFNLQEKRLGEELRLKKFKEIEGTPAHPGVKQDVGLDSPTTSAGATPSGAKVCITM